REDPELPTPPTQEEFLAQEVRHPWALLDAFFLAKRGNLYVGESVLKRSDGDPGLLRQQLTAVLPAHRGQGIAMALKVATIAYAQERGYRVIRTFNSSRNEVMLAINARFGFVRMPAWVTFVKLLDG
ncbi:MAG: GNAT family N-acetyltransferase, partial [bacterium]|nr:GNAT family N-acetyltransferase [bacterium]